MIILTHRRFCYETAFLLAKFKKNVSLEKLAEKKSNVQVHFPRFIDQKNSRIALKGRALLQI